MAYCSVDKVQERIPSQLTEFGEDTQPSLKTVWNWIDMESRWVDGVLSWKYAVPVTDETDVAMLAEIAADLVASRCLKVIGGFGAEEMENSKALRKSALEALAYDAKAGRGMIVLPNTAWADTKEASVGQPRHGFTDPDAEDGSPRLFRISMEF